MKLVTKTVIEVQNEEREILARCIKGYFRYQAEQGCASSDESILLQILHELDPDAVGVRDEVGYEKGIAYTLRADG